MREFENGLDVEGCGDGLVAAAVEAVVDVSGSGHDAAAVVVDGNIAVVARCAVLGIEVVPTWVVYAIALANVEASRVGCAVVVVVVSGAGLAVTVAIGGVGVEGVGTGVLNNVGAIAVVACWLAFDAIVGVVVDVAGNLRLFRLRGRVCIAVSCAFVGLFFCLAVIANRIGFGGFGWIGRCGGG